MEIYAFGLVILAGLIRLAVWLSKGSGYKEAELEQADYEKEIIEENRKAAWANKDTIIRATDDELARLHEKWKRKP